MRLHAGAVEMLKFTLGNREGVQTPKETLH